MVDTSGKKPTTRLARARCYLSISATLTNHLHALPKGDAFSVARIAGIQAAKQTSQLIPLCHPLPLEHIQIDITLQKAEHRILIETSASATAKTGVEMEALTAAAVTALTLYDMCKSVDKGMTIGKLQLIEKLGGKSGHWHR